MANNSLCVELRGISKQYPGSEKKANNNISLDLKQGEILCVAGENGAGKTTLMKILCGLEFPDSGEIFINGKKEEISSPLAAKNLKIGMVHQHFTLFPDYTTAENIVMGSEPRKWGVFVDIKKANETAEKIIADNNFPIKSGVKVKDLTLGEMQQVEICRVLCHNAQIIILDEPTSILTENETQSLFSTLKTLAAKGKSVILITHKLREIKQIGDRTAVLRRGELAGICGAADMDEYSIARMMTGEEKSSFEMTPPRRAKGSGEPVIKFDNVTVLRKGQKHPLLDRVSFSVNEGEIVGVAGVGGNGLGVIEAVLGGFLHPASGKILHRGKDISALNIRALRNQGLAYVPADRLRVASAKDAEIEENLIINRRHEMTKKMLIDKKTAGEFSKKLVENYNIEGARLDEKASVLSGGNLQKLILAREINWLKDYIVFSEPTWGLDIASSRFILKEIAALREKGAAVVLISTNMEEILSLADRIIVMYRGAIAGVFE
ncbi:MAG: ATP-binding cassette domain-containing protein, partial [Treponema sp.]|nr:ATP-binding cassette domain-containing protein [Treponema sp.]